MVAVYCPANNRFYFFHGREPVQFTALLIIVFISFTVENPYSLLPC